LNKTQLSPLRKEISDSTAQKIKNQTMSRGAVFPGFADGFLTVQMIEYIEKAGRCIKLIEVVGRGCCVM
jgi:hypothetical protein